MQYQKKYNNNNNNNNNNNKKTQKVGNIHCRTQQTTSVWTNYRWDDPHGAGSLNVITASLKENEKTTTKNYFNNVITMIM